MVPGLPEKYREKGDLHIVQCKCGHKFASKMKIPHCGKCYKYIYDQ